jgi:hypothetical protein
VYLLVLSGALLAIPVPPAVAQTTIRSVPITLANIIQAADGNYYGIFQGTNLCTAEVQDECPQIFQINPAGGAPQSIHNFDPDSSLNPAGGSVPLSLLEGPDGFLYGTTMNGGDLNDCTTASTYFGGIPRVGCGFFFKVALDGSNFTVLHMFSTAEVDPSTNGSQTAIGGGSLILGSDGNFYGTSGAPPASTLLGAEVFDGQFIYRLTPQGAFAQLYNFDPPTGVDTTVGPGTSALVEGTDGFFYGTTPGVETSGNALPYGTVFKMSPTGQLHVTYTLPTDASMGLNPIAGPLVEGPTGDFYGMTTGFSDLLPPAGTIFRTTSNGGLATLHTFTPASGGFYPTQPLIFAADGNLYGTATTGGDTAACSPLMGCGNIFTMKTDGSGFQDLHDFSGGKGGSYPGAMIADSNGAITGVTGSDGVTGSPAGTIFTTTISAKPTPPITISFYTNPGNLLVRQVPPLTPLTLKWNVLNAFSNTMRQCYAFVREAPDPQWTGRQTGAGSARGYAGQTAIMAPKSYGNYTYVLTCGGVETGSFTLEVGNNLMIDSSFLPDGTVSTSYATLLLAQGGTYPYTWSVISGTLPEGLILDPTTGSLNGTPLQYGDYSVTFQVQDSSTVPLTSETTLSVHIVSGLIPFQATPNAVVGKPYSQILAATGGLPPYVYKFVSGELPTGLSFNASTGLISGTPTMSGAFTFSVSVHDSESPYAIATQIYTISTAVPPLKITTHLDLPDAVVNVPYSATLSAANGTPPYTWTVVSGGKAPAGLTLSPSGVLSGKCLEYGLGYFNAQVTDSENPPVTVSSQFDMNITSGLQIAPFSMPNGTVGVYFEGPIPTASGGLPPYDWRASATPAGQGFDLLSIYASTGEIIGTPTQAATYTVYLDVYDSEGSPATTSISFPWTINPPPLPTTTTLKSSNSTAGTGMPVTFTANVLKSGGGAATGTVSFLNGGAILGSASLDANGNASIASSFSAVGQYSITASYSGTTGLTPSTSAAVIETVVTPTVTAAINPGSLTIKSGASGTLVLTLTPVGGYTGTITFSCGTLPAHVSCTFAPPSLTLAAGSGPESSTLTVNTGAVATAMSWVSNDANGRHISIAMMLLLPGSLFGLVGFRKRKRDAGAARRLFLLAIAALTLAAASALGGCGGPSTAKPGTYTIPITLTLTDGSVQSVNATIIVE